MPETVLKFIHTADLHLDAPMHGLRGVDPEVSAFVAECQRKTFISIIDHCINLGVDFLVIAGDLFDTEQKNISTQVTLKRQFQRLADNGITVYFAAGNHDSLEEAGYLGTGLEISLPENVRIFSGERPREFLHEKNGRTAARIAGMSFPRRAVTENICSLYPRKTDGLFTIGVLHTNAGGFADHDNYAPCTLDDLRATRYDYWALGHIHKRQELCAGSPLALYPGCPQARRSKETGPMSVTLVEVDAAGSATATRIPTGALRLENLNVDITDIAADKHGDLVERAQQEIDALRDSLPAHTDCCIATVFPHGAGPMFNLKLNPYLSKQQGYALDILLDELRIFGAETSPRIWIREIDTSLLSPPREEFDPEALRAEQSVMGEVVRLADSLRSDPALRQQYAGLMMRAVLSSAGASDAELLRCMPPAALDEPAELTDELLEKAMMICLEALKSQEI